MTKDTDAEWEKWGQKDPYFGVLTNERYRVGKVDATALAEFFASGAWHVDYVWSMCQQHLDGAFAPTSVLDFGCGVGRLLPAFADKASRVVGTDVAPSMLQEARRNCDRLGKIEVQLVKSDDALSELHETFGLVHTAIVFQHISPERGRQIFARLLELIAPGGVGAIQVTYAKTIHADSWGVPPPLPPVEVPAVTAVEQAVPMPRRRGLLGVFAGTASTVAAAAEPPQLVPNARDPVVEASTDPEMQMNSYNLNHLLFALQQSGVTRFHTEFTDHGGELGVFLFFQKPSG